MKQLIQTGIMVQIRKRQAVINRNILINGNPATTEPYIVPWLRPGNLDQ